MTAAQGDTPNDASSPDDAEARKPWDIVLAIAAIREVEALVRPLGLFTSLTGGVLYKGHSTKDLDIGFALLGGLVCDFPHASLREALESIGWKRLRTAAEIASFRAEKGEVVTNCVATWVTEENRRVDVFCWGCRP